MYLHAFRLQQLVYPQYVYADDVDEFRPAVGIVAVDLIHDLVSPDTLRVLGDAVIDALLDAHVVERGDGWRNDLPATLAPFHFLFASTAFNSHHSAQTRSPL